MTLIYLPQLRIHARLEGPEGGAPLVLLHGLGLDLSIWDALVAALPRHRILRLDLRGHGGSDVPPAPYRMGAMIGDVEKVMEHFALQEAVVVGHGLGGMIAQGLAVKRLDLVRAMVLTNSAARIGFATQWQARIARVAEGGLSALHDEEMARWLGRNWRDHPALPRLSDLFLSTVPEGWQGAAAAISGSDFYETTATLRLPTLVLATGRDGVTPADLVRETAELIPGHRFALIHGAGHVPMLERPEEFAGRVTSFLGEIGHG